MFNKIYNNYYKCITVMCPHLTFEKKYRVDPATGLFAGDGKEVLYMEDHMKLFEEA